VQHDRLREAGGVHYIMRDGGRRVRPDIVKNVWEEDATMAWTTPTLVEICIGLEINGYLPAEI
jgi:coenzyme PQQ precursor peptide PqqA